MRSLKILCPCAVSALAISIAAPAAAQSVGADQGSDKVSGQATESDRVEEVVVVGVRKSLQTALDAKRRAANVVEVLAAEDIGKLPDLSIAESLARLPGLAGNRDRGNASSISIRGMGPEFTNTLINGRELVSAEASRNVRYESFPAELINGAYVYKSPTAAQAEGAIAGQVNLQTVRPLNYKGQTLYANARGEYSDLAKRIDGADDRGWIGSGAYVANFGDKLGVALGLTGRRQSVTTQRADIWPYVNGFYDYNGDGSATDEVPTGLTALERGGKDKRFGALGTVQWRPSPNFELVADLFYSRLNYSEEQKGFQVEGLAFGNWQSGVGTYQNNGLIGSTGWTNWAATSGYGLLASASNQAFEFKDDLWSGGVNAVWHGDDWSFTADLGYSKTKRDQSYTSVETAPHPDAFGGAGYTVSWQSRKDMAPLFGFNRSLTDPTINVLGYVTNESPFIDDELITVSGDWTKDVSFGPFNELLIGGRATDRSKSFTKRSQTLHAYSPYYYNLVGIQAVPSQFILDPTHFEGDLAGNPDAMNIDIPGLIGWLGGLNPQTTDADRGESWEVKEKTGSIYLQGNFDTTLFGYALTGNLGVRVVRTEQQSLGTAYDEVYDAGTGVTTRTLTPVSYTKRFTDVLPNLNMTLALGKGTQVRFAASKAMARAPLDDLRASFVSYNYGTPATFGGNPDLDPYRATQFDLTFEKYFNSDTAVTVALFHKELDSFIVTQTVSTTSIVNGIPTTGTSQKPVNGQGGRVQGVELSFQQAFKFLPAPFDGLGMYANYSYTDSNVSVAEADNPIGNIPLPGLSKHVGAGGVYYYKAGFETMLGYRTRSDYATNIGGQNLITFNKTDAVMDFFVSYNFSDKTPLKGVSLKFQANNITNAPFETYSGFKERTGRYEVFGRRYFLGVTMKHEL